MRQSCYLNFQPISWSQSIRRYPTINVEGPYLAAPCRTNRSDLILSDGYRLRDLEISLSILQGELEAKHREQLSKNAIGGIWWDAKDQFVHGWFHLQPDYYAEVWDQIRSGGYAHCNINLNVSP